MTKQEQIGKRIKERRNYLGWSQEDLAEKLTVGAAAVSHYERGERNISLDIIAEIAAALRVSQAWLMGEDETKGTRLAKVGKWKVVAASSGETLDLTQEEQRLLDAVITGIEASREDIPGAPGGPEDMIGNREADEETQESADEEDDSLEERGEM